MLYVFLSLGRYVLCHLHQARLFSEISCEMCCSSWFGDFNVVALGVVESIATFLMYDVSDNTAESMFEGVLSGILKVIWFSIMFWNFGQIVLPGVRVEFVLVLIDESLSVRMIGV